MKKNKMKSLVGMSLLMGGLGMHANAAIVYEGFDFTGDIVGGGSGTGWDGNWAGSDNDSRGTPEVGTGLTYSGVSATGGSYSRPQRYGSAEASRVLSTTAQTALTANNSSIYFSVLVNVGTPGNGPSGLGYAANSNAALVFGDSSFTLTAPGLAPSDYAANGNAVGIAFKGDNTSPYSNVAIHGVSYTGTASGDATITAGSTTIGLETAMILGKIDWAENGSNDTLTLYRITDPTAPLGAAFATISADWDQSTFNVIATGQSQTEMFDEIRFDTTLAGVGISPIPEPSSTALLGLGGLALVLRRRK